MAPSKRAKFQIESAVSTALQSIWAVESSHFVRNTDLRDSFFPPCVHNPFTQHVRSGETGLHADL